MSMMVTTLSWKDIAVKEKVKMPCGRLFWGIYLLVFANLMLTRSTQEEGSSLEELQRVFFFLN